MQRKRTCFSRAHFLAEMCAFVLILVCLGCFVGCQEAGEIDCYCRIQRNDTFRRILVHCPKEGPCQWSHCGCGVTGPNCPEDGCSKIRCGCTYTRDARKRAIYATCEMKNSSFTCMGCMADRKMSSQIFKREITNAGDSPIDVNRLVVENRDLLQHTYRYQTVTDVKEQHDIKVEILPLAYNLTQQTWCIQEFVSSCGARLLRCPSEITLESEQQPEEQPEQSAPKSFGVGDVLGAFFGGMLASFALIGGSYFLWYIKWRTVHSEKKTAKSSPVRREQSDAHTYSYVMGSRQMAGNLSVPVQGGQLGEDQPPPVPLGPVPVSPARYAPAKLPQTDPMSGYSILSPPSAEPPCARENPNEEIPDDGYFRLEKSTF